MVGRFPNAVLNLKVNSLLDLLRREISSLAFSQGLYHVPVSQQCFPILPQFWVPYLGQSGLIRSSNSEEKRF